MFIFDPDLLVQSYQPSDLRFPLLVGVDVAMLNETQQLQLPQATAHNPKVLLTLCDYNDQELPVMVKVWTPDVRPAIWIPWAFCTPDLTLLPN